MFMPLPAVEILTEAAVAAIAIVFLVYGSRVRRQYQEELGAYGARTEGVVSRQWKKEVVLDGGETTTTWYADYRYTVDGQVYEASSGRGHYKKMFADGQAVTICYRPEAPEEFYVIEENGHDRTTYRIIYALGIIVVGIGVAFLVLFHLVFGR